MYVATGINLISSKDFVQISEQVEKYCQRLEALKKENGKLSEEQVPELFQCLKEVLKLVVDVLRSTEETEKRKGILYYIIKLS